MVVDMPKRKALLVHPAFTGALVVLVLNDHVLKAAFSNAITGKLSDFAGLFVITILLALVLPVRPALALAGTGFVVLKLWRPAAELAAPVLGGVTLQDPTDLVALLILPIAYRVFRGHRVPEGPGAATSLAAVASGAIAFVSITATSCADPPVVAAVATDEGTGSVYARVFLYEWEGGQEVEWARSDDGGLNWVQVATPAEDPSRPPLPICGEDRTCYRVVANDRVEQKMAGGEWITAFAFTEEELSRMRLRRGSGCVIPLEEDLFRSMTVVDEHDSVVVAMGSQGVLTRAPDGSWRRIGVLDTHPVQLWGPRWLNWVWAGASLGLVGISMAYLVAGRQRGRRQGGKDASARSGIAAAALLPLAGLIYLFSSDYAITGLVVTALATGAFAWSLYRFYRPAPRRPVAMGRVGLGPSSRPLETGTTVVATRTLWQRGRLLLDQGEKGTVTAILPPHRVRIRNSRGDEGVVYHDLLAATDREETGT